MWRRWLTAVLATIFLASFVAAFGPRGIAAAAYLLAILSTIWLRRVGRKGDAKILLVLVIALPIVVLLLSSLVSPARESARRTVCGNHMKQIAIALNEYHERNGCFPPAYTCDPDGKPMHSWRVLLLPFLEEEALYKKYNFGEPWNGPNNRLLESNMPEAYSCPTAAMVGANPPPMTSYVAVTGPETAWPMCSSRRRREITAGTGRTVFLVEVANSNIHWMEPRDPRLEDVLASQTGDCEPLTSHHVTESYWLAPEPGSGYVACPDCANRFLPGRISMADAKAMLTVTDGTGLDIAAFAENMPLVGHPRWDHIIGLPVFCLSFVGLLVLALTTRRREPQLATEPSVAE